MSINRLVCYLIFNQFSEPPKIFSWGLAQKLFRKQTNINITCSLTLIEHTIIINCVLFCWREKNDMQTSCQVLSKRHLINFKLRVYNSIRSKIKKIIDACNPKKKLYWCEPIFCNEVALEIAQLTLTHTTNGMPPGIPFLSCIVLYKFKHILHLDECVFEGEI